MRPGVEKSRLWILPLGRLKRTFQLSSGQKGEHNSGPKALKLRGFLSQGWRWHLSTRPSRNGMREASAKGKPGRLRWERRCVTGQAGNLAGPCDGRRRKPEIAAAKGTVKGRGLGQASAVIACVGAFGPPCECEKRGSESRMPARAPVRNPAAKGRMTCRAGSDIGRQVRLGPCGVDGPPEVPQKARASTRR